MVEQHKEIEVYEPSHCFRCQAPIYLRVFEFESGHQTSVAYDYYRNSRHFCINRSVYETPASIKHD